MLNLNGVGKGSQSARPNGMYMPKVQASEDRDDGACSVSTCISQERPLEPNSLNLLLAQNMPRKRHFTDLENENLSKLVSQNKRPNGQIAWDEVAKSWNELQDISKAASRCKSKATLKRRFFEFRAINTQNPQLTTGEPVRDVPDGITIPEGWHIDSISRSNNSKAWSLYEDNLLVQTHLSTPPCGYKVDWNEIHLEMVLKLRDAGLKPRTLSALQTRMRFIMRHKKAVTLNKENSNVSPIQTLHNATESNTMSNPNTPVRLNGYDEDGNPFIIDEQVFGDKLETIYRKALQSKKRILLGKPKNIPDQFLAWIKKFIHNKMQALTIDNPKYIKVLNAAVYSGAATVGHFMKKPTDARNKATKRKITDQIDQRKYLLKCISLLEAEIKRRVTKLPPTQRQKDNREWLSNEFKGSRSTSRLKALNDSLKQELRLLQLRIKTDEEERERRKARFTTPKLLLRDKTEDLNETPIDNIRNYWAQFIGKERKFVKTDFLEQWTTRNRMSKELALIPKITENSEWQEVVSKMKPWKACGPDGIHAFWWRLNPASELLYKWVYSRLSNGEKLPLWMSRGRAILLHKGGDRADPGNFRTICCLNTCYKLLTGLMTKWLQRYTNHCIPREQFAMRKGIWGCTQAHMLDSAVCMHAKVQKKDLSMAWIDFSKAFDSIPHKYLKWLLKNLNVPEGLRKAFNYLLKRGEITYECTGNDKVKVFSSPLRIRNGVMQGDTLSPFLFCLGLAPVSSRLNYRIEPYRMDDAEITHTFYMDDLKIYSPNYRSLDNTLNTLENIIKSIGLRLNPKKCAQAHLFKGVLSTSHRGPINYPIIDWNAPYKYLGIQQVIGPAHEQVFDRLETAIITKASSIFSSKMSIGQKVNCFNTMVVPVATYVFQNCLDYTGKFQTQTLRCRELDCKIRKVLYENKLKFKSCCSARLYIHPEKGGLGIKRLETEFLASKMYALTYLCLQKECEETLDFFKKMDAKGKRTIINDALKIAKERSINVCLGQTGLIVDGEQTFEVTITARALARRVRHHTEKCDLDYWLSTTSGNRVTNAKGIDPEKSCLWIKKGMTSGRVLRNIFGLQEYKLMNRTNPSARAKLKTCRVCGPSNGDIEHPNAALETIVHIVSICPHWRDTLMVRRHNAVAREIYFELCKWAGLRTVHYREIIEPIIENQNIRLCWDVRLATPISIKHNRPDITLFDKNTRTVYVCEIAVSWALTGEGLPQMEKRKYSKYAINSNLPEDHTFPYPAGENLKNQLIELYGYRVEVLPIVVGVAGEVSLTLADQLKKLPIAHQRTEHLIEKMSRAAVEGTNLIICRHLNLTQ